MSDVYLDDCLARLAELGADPTAFGRDHGLLLLKPDAVVGRRLLPAIDWLSRHGFRIVAAERTRLDRHAIRAVWREAWRDATWQRRRLADLLAAATDSLVLLVRAESTEPVSVRLTAMKRELRHTLGTRTFLLNMAHTADEPVDVLRELAIYFDTDDLERVLGDALTGTDRLARAVRLADELHAVFPAQSLDLADRSAALLRDVDDPPDRDLLAEVVLRAWQHGVRLDPWHVIVVGAAVLPMTVRRGVTCSG